MGLYVSVSLAAAAMAVFILAEALRVGPKLRTLLKFIAGLGFLSVAVAAQIENSRSAELFAPLMCGLAFGILGDFLLAARDLFPKKDTPLICGGIGAFFAGHISYIVYLTYVYPVGWPEFVIAAAVAAAFMLVTVFGCKLKYGKLLAPCAAYSFIVMCIAACAVCAFIHGMSAATALLLAGGILFPFSDVILAFIMFGPKGDKRVLSMFNLATYFPAQILIALSLAFL